MNLNEEVIFQIANCKDRLQCLSLVQNHVYHRYNTLSDNLRNEILFDSILNLIEFCLRKGFLLDECVTCSSIFYLIISKFDETMSSSSTSLTESLDLFSTRLIGLSNHINKDKLKEFIDYMNLTFFTHFNLYKYVFMNEQENSVQNESRFVYCPTIQEEESAQVCLGTAKTFPMWEYDNNIAKLDDMEKYVKEKYDKERSNLIEMSANQTKDCNLDEQLNQDVNEKLIEQLIKDISSPILETEFFIEKSNIKEFSELHVIKEQKYSLVKPEPLVILPTKKGTVLANKDKGKKK